MGGALPGGSRRRRPGGAWILAVCGLALLLLTGMAAAGSSAPPPLIGLSRGKLVALDPRTLEPLPSPRPLPVGPPGGRIPSIVLSPDGSRLAVLRPTYHLKSITGYAALVVDRTRLRILRRFRPEGLHGHADADQEFVWARGASLILASNLEYGPGHVFGECAHLDFDGETEFYAAVAARTPEGLVLLLGGSCGEIPGSFHRFQLFFHPPPSDESDVEVALDPATTVSMAVDAHRNRLFLVSSTGAIAVVGLRSGRVQYHSVALPAEIRGGDAYKGAWAGAGHLAFWGLAGLTLIDTRDWSARLVDASTTDVAVAPNAVVAWNRKAATGLTVYAPDGSMRFRALAGHRVLGVGVSARYAYVTGGGRFSVDLRSGRVTGPLRSRARLVLPDLLDLP